MAPAAAPSGIVVVGNPRAGSHDEEAVAAARAVWASAGVAVEVVATSDADDLAQVVTALDGRILVAAGGDGSIHAVAQALSDATMLDEVVVGLLPMGTGNDLARGIGLSLEAEEAAQSLLDGGDHAMDLLVDQDGMVAVNAVHMGLGAVAADRATTMKPTLGAAAYPVGALRAGATESGWQLRVTVDGQAVVASAEVLQVVVANGPSLGGGTLAVPDARADDGQLHVMVSTATGPMARVGYATDLRRGVHVDRDDVVVVRGAHVEVTGDDHPHNVDGELPPDRARSSWTVQPGAWHLRHAGSSRPGDA